jgi:hypothetical protein
MIFCTLYAIRLNSTGYLRTLCRRRNTAAVFKLPHPIVQDISETDTAPVRLRKISAIAIIESKLWSLTFGISVVAYYFTLLYILYIYNRSSFICKAPCQILLFGIKTIGSGLMFDFLDDFNIKISDVQSNSLYLSIVSFCTKCVVVAIVIRLFTLYFAFRKKYGSILRPFALTMMEGAAGIERLNRTKRG